MFAALLKLLNPWYILAAVAALAAAYAFGHSSGVDSGKQSRQKEVEVLQETIRLTEADIRKRNDEARARLDEINREVSDLAAQNALLRKQVDEKQQTVITKWKTKIVPGACGISADTTEMVREVLATNQKG